jgi:type IX secretion system PorP/SprF family membrane protein
MKKIIIILLIYTVGSFVAHAQSEPKLSLFSYNPLYYNPAYAGAFNGLSITSIYSTQWVGLEGAPKTLFFSAHSNVISREVGLGVDFTNDKIGPIEEKRMVGNFAYYIDLNDEISLSLGIKAGIRDFLIDYNMLSIENPEEYGLANGIVSQKSPVFGSGMYLSNEKFYFGFSVPNILKTKFYDEYRNSVVNTKPNYFMSGGYKFEVERDVYLQPNILARVTTGAPVSILYSVNLDYKDLILASVNIQPSSSLGAFFGLRFENNISIGYAYDSSLLKFAKYNDGCHSFYINFKIEELLEVQHYGFGTF